MDRRQSLVIAESACHAPQPLLIRKMQVHYNGNAIVGNNAALGIGFASEAELKAVLGQFLDANGSFTEAPDAAKIDFQTL